ncbi:hypothetical protein FRC04_006967 [Tulasnella sp. 424]|nr:hypothetical protein FRC04_006967 [Tulasnella sp. 424]KAG8960057.1 hypothetical protein FRC05_007131 [Tulasnella sp. 425]
MDTSNTMDTSNGPADDTFSLDSTASSTASIDFEIPAKPDARFWELVQEGSTLRMAYILAKDLEQQLDINATLAKGEGKKIIPRFHVEVEPTSLDFYVFDEETYSIVVVPRPNLATSPIGLALAILYRVGICSRDVGYPLNATTCHPSAEDFKGFLERNGGAVLMRRDQVQEEIINYSKEEPKDAAAES